MKLSLDNQEGRYRIQGYSAQGVKITGQWYSGHLLLTADRLVDDWRPPAPEAMTVGDFEPILAPAPDVVLLGTGPTPRFPPARLIAEFARRGMGLEVMGTEAACRTFNILLSEDRPAAAALIIGDES